MDIKHTRGVVTPGERYRFETPGGNALMYDAPMGLQIYTPHELKLKWWQHLGIISGYGQMGEYHFVGRDITGAAFDEWIPLFFTGNVQPLVRPVPKPIHYRDDVYRRRVSDPAFWWGAIAHSKYKTLRETAAYFIDSGEDLRRFQPKFHLLDFMVVNRKIFSLDPFVDIVIERLARG